MSTVDFEQIFDAIPANYLVYDLEMTIVADATLGNARVRNGLLSGNQFDVFPDNPRRPQGRRKAAFQRALDSVWALRCRLPVTTSTGTSRGSEPVNEPVFDAGGRITHIGHGVVDVTASHPGGGSGAMS